MTKLPHLLFDYDNTLGLTEKPAFTACCAVVNKTLKVKGVSELFSVESLMKRFVGYSFRKMITDLSVEHNFGFEEGELERLVAEEVDAVVEKLASEIQPTAGVNELLATLSGDYKLAVVSSSALRRVKACLAGANQADFFGERIFSAAHYGSSKPDPRVYNEALKALGVEAKDCLAIEDSRTGAMSAIGAGIPVMGYLGAYASEEHEEITRALKAVGVKVIIKDWSEFNTALAQFQGS